MSNNENDYTFECRNFWATITTEQLTIDRWHASVAKVVAVGATEAEAIFALSSMLASIAEIATSLAHAVRVSSDDSGSSWSITQRRRADELIANALRASQVQPESK